MLVSVAQEPLLRLALAPLQDQLLLLGLTVSAVVVVVVVAAAVERVCGCYSGLVAHGAVGSLETEAAAAAVAVVVVVVEAVVAAEVAEVAEVVVAAGVAGAAEDVEVVVFSVSTASPSISQRCYLVTISSSTAAEPLQAPHYNTRKHSAIELKQIWRKKSSPNLFFGISAHLSE